MNKKTILLFIAVNSVAFYLLFANKTNYSFLLSIFGNSSIILFYIRSKSNFIVSWLPETSQKILSQEVSILYKQLESHINLVQFVKPIAPLPPLRGWAASPDFLLHLTNTILAYKPMTIVEASSGSSTLIAAYNIQSLKNNGKVYSLDHDEYYAKQTRELLRIHQLDHIAQVYHAPLNDSNPIKKNWYDLQYLKNISSIDLLVIDGPPTTGIPHARFPALPLLISKLNPGALILLDDSDRQGERDMIQEWERSFPNIRITLLEAEKGTALIRIT